MTWRKYAALLSLDSRGTGPSSCPSSDAEGAHLTDHDLLGPGGPDPGCRAGSDDVQPPAEAVRQHRGAAAGAAEDLHHQPGLRERHHQPAGCPGPDSLPAQCPDGQGGGVAHDQRAGVGHSHQGQVLREASGGKTGSTSYVAVPESNHIKPPCAPILTSFLMGLCAH